jgi:hypothetical protein
MSFCLYFRRHLKKYVQKMNRYLKKKKVLATCLHVVAQLGNYIRVQMKEAYAKFLLTFHNRSAFRNRRFN